MKFNDITDIILEGKISGHEFAAALGGPEEHSKYKAELKKKAAMKSSLVKNNPEVWEEYVNEAEHMEGYSYWDFFNNTEQLLYDFKLYLENR